MSVKENLSKLSNLNDPELEYEILNDAISTYKKTMSEQTTSPKFLLNKNSIFNRLKFVDLILIDNDSLFLDLKIKLEINSTRNKKTKMFDQNNVIQFTNFFELTNCILNKLSKNSNFFTVALFRENLEKISSDNEILNYYGDILYVKISEKDKRKSIQSNSNKNNPNIFNKTAKGNFNTLNKEKEIIPIKKLNRTNTNFSNFNIKQKELIKSNSNFKGTNLFKDLQGKSPRNKMSSSKLLFLSCTEREKYKKKNFINSDFDLKSPSNNLNTNPDNENMDNDNNENIYKVNNDTDTNGVDIDNEKISANEYENDLDDNNDKENFSKENSNKNFEISNENNENEIKEDIDINNNNNTNKNLIDNKINLNQIENNSNKFYNDLDINKSVIINDQISDTKINKENTNSNNTSIENISMDVNIQMSIFDTMNNLNKSAEEINIEKNNTNNKKDSKKNSKNINNLLKFCDKSKKNKQIDISNSIIRDNLKKKDIFSKEIENLSNSKKKKSLESEKNGEISKRLFEAEKEKEEKYYISVDNPQNSSRDFNLKNQQEILREIKNLRRKTKINQRYNRLRNNNKYLFKSIDKNINDTRNIKFSKINLSQEKFKKLYQSEDNVNIENLEKAQKFEDTSYLLTNQSYSEKIKARDSMIENKTNDLITSNDLKDIRKKEFFNNLSKPKFNATEKKFYKTHKNLKNENDNSKINPNENTFINNFNNFFQKKINPDKRYNNETNNEKENRENNKDKNNFKYSFYINDFPYNEGLKENIMNTNSNNSVFRNTLLDDLKIYETPKPKISLDKKFKIKSLYKNNNNNNTNSTNNNKNNSNTNNNTNNNNDINNNSSPKIYENYFKGVKMNNNIGNLKNINPIPKPNFSSTQNNYFTKTINSFSKFSSMGKNCSNNNFSNRSIINLESYIPSLSSSINNDNRNKNKFLFNSSKKLNKDETEKIDIDNNSKINNLNNISNSNFSNEKFKYKSISSKKTLEKIKKFLDIEEEKNSEKEKDQKFKEFFINENYSLNLNPFNKNMKSMNNKVSSKKNKENYHDFEFKHKSTEEKFYEKISNKNKLDLKSNRQEFKKFKSPLEMKFSFMNYPNLDKKVENEVKQTRNLIKNFVKNNLNALIPNEFIDENLKEILLQKIFKQKLLNKNFNKDKEIRNKEKEKIKNIKNNQNENENQSDITSNIYIKKNNNNYNNIENSDLDYLENSYNFNLGNVNFLDFKKDTLINNIISVETDAEPLPTNLQSKEYQIIKEFLFFNFLNSRSMEKYFHKRLNQNEMVINQENKPKMINTSLMFLNNNKSFNYSNLNSTGTIEENWFNSKNHKLALEFFNLKNNSKQVSELNGLVEELLNRLKKDISTFVSYLNFLGKNRQNLQLKNMALDLIFVNLYMIEVDKKLIDQRIVYLFVEFISNEKEKKMFYEDMKRMKYISADIVNENVEFYKFQFLLLKRFLKMITNTTEENLEIVKKEFSITDEEIYFILFSQKEDIKTMVNDIYFINKITNVFRILVSSIN